MKKRIFCCMVMAALAGVWAGGCEQDRPMLEGNRIGPVDPAEPDRVTTRPQYQDLQNACRNMVVSILRSEGVRNYPRRAGEPLRVKLEPNDTLDRQMTDSILYYCFQSQTVDIVFVGEPVPAGQKPLRIWVDTIDGGYWKSVEAPDPGPALARPDMFLRLSRARYPDAAKDVWTYQANLVDQTGAVSWTDRFVVAFRK